MNGIDLAPFAAADPQFWLRHPQVGERAPLLGAVGAFYKGQEELIGLLPSLIEEFPRLALILIGEDEERKHLLQQLAQQSGVAEAVVFAGRIPREQMKDALCGLDLNVSAFRNEGFGLSVVEGLAGGTPFVGYRAGGYPEIITDAATGCLVETEQELAEAIVALLRDRQLSAGGSAACRKAAGSYSIANMVDAYQSLYKKLA